MSDQKIPFGTLLSDKSADEAELLAIQAGFANVSDEELEARITKETGGSGGNAYC